MEIEKLISWQSRSEAKETLPDSLIIYGTEKVNLPSVSEKRGV